MIEQLEEISLEEAVEDLLTALGHMSELSQGDVQRSKRIDLWRLAIIDLQIKAEPLAAVKSKPLQLFNPA